MFLLHLFIFFICIHTNEAKSKLEVLFSRKSYMSLYEVLVPFYQALCSFFLSLFCDSVLLCSPGWLGICHVDQPGLKLAGVHLPQPLNVVFKGIHHHA